MGLPSLYDMLKDVLPDDHARQSSARSEVEARVATGFTPADILDLGCGVGATAELFRTLLPEARWTGVDIEESPEVAERDPDTTGNFVTFNGVNLPFDDERFDLIFSHQVFEHVRHPEALLGEVRRCIARDGLFIGQTSQLEPYHSFSLWNYTIHGFRVLLEEAGLRLLLMRPGIDGLTLIERALRGRPKEWRKWFSTESPLNQKLDRESKGRPIRIRNYRKLIYCGQFVFVAAPGPHPRKARSRSAEVAPTRSPAPEPQEYACPICGGGTFATYRGRANARCAGCGAKERARLMALALNEAPVDPHGCPVYHFAPEPGLAAYFAKRFGPLYNAADIDPKLYDIPEVSVRQVDLCEPLDYFRPESIGGFIHSHVLEHVPASIDRIIAQMNHALVPGGFHAFQVPIHAGWSREDMDPGLGPEERRTRFYQEDHMRVFGTRDFADRVLRLFQDGFRLIEMAALIDDAEVRRAGIPPSAVSRPTGHSVFLFVKDL